MEKDQLYSTVYLQFIAHTHTEILIFTKFPINEECKKYGHIFLSFIWLSSQENDYNMNMDTHVVDRDRLNTNTLQQTIWSLFINWREGFF